MNVYGLKTKAYFDTFGGLVPCVVTGITRTAIDRGREQVDVTARVEKSRAGYRKGEVVTMRSFHVVPRKQVVTRGLHLRIKMNYEWR